MNCERFQWELPGYLHDDPAGTDWEEFSRHARDCPACRRLLEEMEKMMAQIADFSGPVFSPKELAALRGRVMEAIRSPGLAPQSRTVRSRMRIFSSPLFLPAASVVAAAAILLIVFLPSRSRVGERSDLPQSADLVAFSEEVEVEERLVAEVWEEIEDIELLFSPDPASPEPKADRWGLRVSA